MGQLIEKARQALPKPKLIFRNRMLGYLLPTGRFLPVVMGGANDFITPDIIARLAYANLYAQTVMAQLVYRDFDSDFAGAVGDTITVRKPAVFQANSYNRAAGITVQDATENSFTVTLDTLLDVSFAVTAEQLTLDIAAFNEQLIVPATKALMEAIDAKLLSLRSDITQEVGYGTTEAWSDPRSLIDARTVLTKNKVPSTDRYAVTGPTTAGEWLKDQLFINADQRGDTDGLREASIGRKFGFDTYESQNVGEPKAAGAQVTGDPTTEENLAFHRSAFALVARTLALPKGKGPDAAAVFGDEGFGVRVVFDYDINKKQDVCSLDVLVGAKTLDANRAVLIKGQDHA